MGGRVAATSSWQWTSLCTRATRIVRVSPVTVAPPSTRCAAASFQAAVPPLAAALPSGIASPVRSPACHCRPPSARPLLHCSDRCPCSSPATRTTLPDSRAARNRFDMRLEDASPPLHPTGACRSLEARCGRAHPWVCVPGVPAAASWCCCSAGRRHRSQLDHTEAQTRYPRRSHTTDLRWNARHRWPRRLQTSHTRPVARFLTVQLSEPFTDEGLTLGHHARWWEKL